MQKKTLFKNKLGVGVSAALLSALVLTANTAAVFAEEETETAVTTTSSTAASLKSGISMTTDYLGVTVNAGDTMTFDLDFASLDGEGYNVTLSSETPDGWSSYFSGSSTEISKLYIGADAAAEGSQATYHLTVPEDAQEGTYEVTILADAGDASDSITLEVSVSPVASGSGTFAADYPEQQGAIGSSFSFDGLITNNRGVDQDYTLTYDAPEDWTVTFTVDDTQVTSATVTGEDDKEVTIAVTPNAGVEAGTYTVSCTAASEYETLTTDLTVEVTGSYGVSLSTDDGLLSFDAYSNDGTNVTLKIENTGSIDLENLELSGSASSNWDVTFSEDTIESLAAGESTTVTMTVTPDGDAITGDYSMTVDLENDDVSDDLEFRVTVKTRTSWGVAAIAIIVVLLACLALIFKKFGRR